MKLASVANRPPTGTVTFLFTDIEGSTRLWELHPETMAVALASHNQVLQDVLAQHRGHVFKTVGDAFCSAFSDPSLAVAAAVDAQRALHNNGWPSDIGELRVRMAIHTGSAARRERDYFGPTINRVARLLSIAHGGQILLSSASAALLANVQLDGVVFRDLGLHRLKDLKQAEPTYQVVADGLRANFPALASLDVHPNNLPSQLSSFIGRTDELTRVQQRLAEYRVVTIAGSGGIGKTRLALQIAADLVERFPGGVFSVPLAPVASGALIVNALASALNVTELPSESLEKTVFRYVGGKKMLVVFDNSEHLLAECARLVKHLLSECANVRCLVTGREPLHLVGEDVERLVPLPLPKSAQSIADLEAGDASRLFLERARAVTAGDLSLTVADCSSISDLCRRLDGIPLAIELAASRLATMPLRRLASKLSSLLLINKDPTAEQRHRTLRDAIDWSYRLLDAPEQQVFLALAVFHGGCALEALEHVAGGDIDDAVESLVDKSLVQVDLDELGRTRYRLLEPIAEFATLELGDSQLQGSFLRRHFDFHAKFAKAAAEAGGDEKEGLLHGLDRDMDNLRAALRWAIENDPAGAARLGVDLAAFWRSRGSFSEGRSWFAHLLDRSALLPARLHANLLRACAAFAAMQDDYASSAAMASAALNLYRELADEVGMGAALHTIGEVSHRQGRLEDAERLYGEALTHLIAGGHLLGTAICLMNLGILARERKDFAAANDLLAKAAASAQRLNDRSAWAQIHIERAWVMLRTADPDAAERAFREALEEKQGVRDFHGVCQARLGVATAALKALQTESALREYAVALKEAQTLGAQIFVIDAIQGIAAVHALNADLVTATQYCALAAQLAERTKCEPRTGLAYTIAAEQINRGLSEQERAVAMAAGALLRLEDVTAALASY